MKIRWLFLVGFFVLLFFLVGCAPPPTTVPRSPTPIPPVVDAKKWAGDWQEEWPGAEENDRYRITVSQDGYTLSIQPLTRIDRQQISNIRWNGAELNFTLIFGENKIEYALRMDSTGNVLSGAVTMMNGTVKNIVWRRIGGAPENWPPQNRLIPQTQFNLPDWAGDWEEDFGESSGHDRYRISLPEGGQTVEVLPLNATITQVVRNLKFDGARLNFELQYGSKLYYYELVPQDGNTLDGVATAIDGAVRRIRWRRIVLRDPNLIPQWNFLWREKQQDGEEVEIWEIRVSAEKIEVIPLSGSEQKKIENISFDGVRLFFTARMGEQALDYALTMTNVNTLNGTAMTDEGRKINTTWEKFQPPPVASWNGVWQEHWPNSSSDDYYRVSLNSGVVTVTPMTNIEKQKVLHARLEGIVLRFTLQMPEVAYEYTLTLTEDGKAAGSAGQAGGQVFQITWERTKTPARTDLVGAWNEQFGSGGGFHDEYQIRVERDKVFVKPLTNLQKQKIKDVSMSWADLTLTFAIEFGEMTWHYRLTLVAPKKLIGNATSQEGKSNSLVWTRTSEKVAPTAIRAWAGRWAEQIQNNPTTDIYQLVVRGNEIVVKPKTKVEEQVISLVHYEDGVLRFHLNYRTLAFDYYLTLQDDETIRCTIITAGNAQIRHAQWFRMQEE